MELKEDKIKIEIIDLDRKGMKRMTRMKRYKQN